MVIVREKRKVRTPEGRKVDGSGAIFYTDDKLQVSSLDWSRIHA